MSTTRPLEDAPVTPLHLALFRDTLREASHAAMTSSAELVRRILLEYRDSPSTVPPEDLPTRDPQTDTFPEPGRAVLLPEAAVETLRRLESDATETKDRATINAYIADLTAAGWSVRAVGHALGMSGEAIRKRAATGARNADTRPTGVPPVPRRSPYAQLPSGDTIQFSFRMAPEQYAPVRDRAYAEGAQINAIVHAGLERFLQMSEPQRQEFLQKEYPARG